MWINWFQSSHLYHCAYPNHVVGRWMADQNLNLCLGITEKYSWLVQLSPCDGLSWIHLMWLFTVFRGKWGKKCNTQRLSGIGRNEFAHHIRIILPVLGTLQTPLPSFVATWVPNVLIFHICAHERSFYPNSLEFSTFLSLQAQSSLTSNANSVE